MEIFGIIIRSLAAFLLVTGIVHLLGKQTQSQMTYRDFIASITLGSIAGNLVFNTTIQISTFIASLLFFSGIIFVATLLSLKNTKARAIFNGEPTVIIQNGKLLEKNMKKIKLTLDSMNQALRAKDIFDIDEVEYALIEASGQLSVLKKAPFQNITKKDLGIFTPARPMFPVELIMDGQLFEKNFEENNITKSWFFTELEQRGVSLSDVTYCVRGTNGQLYFDLYKDKISSPVDAES
jgi:uncharacterized membrane protein YcaP (DUF421 family)